MSNTAALAALHSSLWDRCAGDWAELQEPRMDALYQIVLKALALAPGSRLLDVGCASGIFCQRASQVGAEATGLDSSRALLGIASQRVPHVRFFESDMESLPFEDNSFDVVTGLNAFYYAASPLRALQEACRVLKPHGRMVFSAWGKPDRCDSGGVFEALNLLMPPPLRNVQNPFSFSANGALKAIAAKAGFTEMVRAEALLNWNYPNEQTALRAVLANSPAQRTIDLAGESRVHEAVRSVLAPFRLPRGGFRIQNYFKYLVAQKT